MNFIHQFFELFFFRWTTAASQQFDDNFRVHRGREGRAFQKQSAAQIQCIDQVAIMSQGHRTIDAICLQRLHVVRNGRTRGGIADMADTDMAFLFWHITKYFCHQTHTTECFHVLAVSGSDPRTFLSTMLQRKNAVVHFMNGRQVMVKNAKDATLFMGLVVINFCTFVHAYLLLKSSS